MGNESKSWVRDTARERLCSPSWALALRIHCVGARVKARRKRKNKFTAIILLKFGAQILEIFWKTVDKIQCGVWKKAVKNYCYLSFFGVPM